MKNSTKETGLRVLTIRVPAETYHEVRARAVRSDRTNAEVIVEAVSKLVARDNEQPQAATVG